MTRVGLQRHSIKKTLVTGIITQPLAVLRSTHRELHQGLDNRRSRLDSRQQQGILARSQNSEKRLLVTSFCPSVRMKQLCFHWIDIHYI